MVLARWSVALLVVVFTVAGCDALTSPQHRLERARTELDSGQLGRAAIDLRKLVQADPNNAEAWLLLARLALDVGDAGVADVDLNHAAAAGARGTELDSMRVSVWLSTGKGQALVDALKRQEFKGISEPERTIDLARGYRQLHQLSQSESLLQQVLQAQPNLPEAHLVLADVLMLEGKIDPALSEIDRVLALDPHSVTAYALRARMLEGRQDLSGAERAYASALQNVTPKSPVTDRLSALVGLTSTRLAQGKIDLAAQSQAALMKLAPGVPQVQLLGARLKLLHGDTLGGIADLQGLVAHVPNFIQAQLVLGTAELKQGNLGQAEQALQQVVQLAPDNVEARELLASIQLQLNQPEQAMSTLTPAMSMRPADGPLLSLLGAVQSESATPDAVLQSLEADAKAHPQDRTTQLNLAEAYLFSGRALQALTLIETTPEVAGDTRREALKIMAVNMVQGAKAASTQVERLLASHARDTAVLDLAAAFYLMQGQPARAHALLEQALAVDPHNIKTLMTLSRTAEAQGDVPAAEKSLRTALALAPSSVQIKLALTDVLIRAQAFVEAESILASISGPQLGATVQFERAHLALARGDLKQGNAALDEAIRQQPKDAELVGKAGELLMQARQYDAALARFSSASQLAPNNALYWFGKGRAELALNHTAAARDSLQRAAQLRPQWMAPVGALVFLDLQAKDPQRALNRVNEVLASRPQDIDALVLRGDIEAATGDLKTAESTYAQVQQRAPSAGIAVKLFRVRLAAHESDPEQPLVQWLTLAPHDLSMRRVLGSYYVSEHALPQATTQLQSILEEVPGDVLALNDLAWVYSEQNDPRAEALAQRAHELAPEHPNVDDTYGWILAKEGKSQQALPLLAQAAKLDSADPDVQYHYAYALAKEGRRVEARQILSSLLSDKREFTSRRDAERLLASTRT
jgi:putative PEP-CTERM system TPR-repeat lipoprotein